MLFFFQVRQQKQIKIVNFSFRITRLQCYWLKKITNTANVNLTSKKAIFTKNWHNMNVQPYL